MQACFGTKEVRISDLICGRVCVLIGISVANAQGLATDSFYPIFPAPDDLASDVNLDMTHQHLLRLESRAPDVLILPSKLKHFAKASFQVPCFAAHTTSAHLFAACVLQIVDSVVTINPSHLAKSSAPGTFCQLSIHPMDEHTLAGLAAKEGKSMPEEHRLLSLIHI